MSARVPGRHGLYWRRASDGAWLTHPSLVSDYLTAVARHRVLDDARLAGRLPLVDALVVRSTDDTDPRWHDAETDGTLGYLFVGRVKGTVDDRTPARRIGERMGYVAREGGWVYKGTRPVIQGWTAFRQRQRLDHLGLMVTYRDPRTDGPFRYAVNDLLDVDPAVVFAPKETA